MPINRRRLLELAALAVAARDLKERYTAVYGPAPPRVARILTDAVSRPDD